LPNDFTVGKHTGLLLVCHRRLARGLPRIRAPQGTPEDDAMQKIVIKGISKLFGRSPAEALRLLAAGATKEEVQRRTGTTVGVYDVNLTINHQRRRIFRRHGPLRQRQVHPAALH